jgi:hypothetical protein
VATTRTRVGPGVRIAIGVVAAVLIVVATTAPVWEARLDVLQYPGQQLVLTAYPDRLVGDVEEVQILNHYVGLRLFDMAELWETTLWWPAIVAALAAVALATALPRRIDGGGGRWRIVGTLARLALWLIPVGILADIQLRLYELGHSMDPGAAFRQPPFIPPVVGAAQVSSNVHTTAWPGTAVWLLLGAAVLMTFGTSLVVFAEQLIGVDAGRADDVPAPTG